MNRFLLGFIWAVASSVASTATQRTLHLSAMGVQPDKNVSVAPRLNQILDSLKHTYAKHDTLILRFSTGTYYFDVEGSPQREVYISNHDQVGLRHIGILVDVPFPMILDGMGSEFIFRDRMLPIAVIGTKSVELKNFSIDFSEPQISQVEIVRNLGESGMEYRPAPWVRWRMDVQGRFECYGSNWSNVPRGGIVFDGKSHHTKYRVSDIGYSTSGLTSRGNGTLYAPRWVDTRLEAGDVVTMRSWERPQPAIFVDGATDSKFRGISVHYADGMGLLAQNSHNISLDHFNVCRRGETDPRLFTTQADATHFSGCSGMIAVRNGLFEHMMDDAINVHGVYLKVIKRLDDYTLEAKYMHSQAWGFDWGRRGDSVQFVYSNTFDSLRDYNVIEQIDPDKPTGMKTFRIRFKHRIPKDITPENSIGLENMRKIPSVIFAGNTIRNNRARGALFNSSKLIIVEGNHFDHISGAAIVASTDCNQWFESGQTQKLWVRGNIFTDVLTSLYQFTEAVISLYPVIPDLAKQKTPFYGDGSLEGIKIEDNLFQTFDTPLLYALSVKGLVWRNNIVRETKTFPKYHHNQEPFKLIGCKSIFIKQDSIIRQ